MLRGKTPIPKSFNYDQDDNVLNNSDLISQQLP